jgi:hypothetical protein
MRSTLGGRWERIPAGLECPILYSNSAARAGRLGSIAAAAIAVEAATKPRRVILVFALIFLSSGFVVKRLLKEIQPTATALQRLR